LGYRKIKLNHVLRGVHEVEIEFDVHIAATMVEQHIIPTTSLLLITRFTYTGYKMETVLWGLLAASRLKTTKVIKILI
jgi:hypothetical protein